MQVFVSSSVCKENTVPNQIKIVRTSWLNWTGHVNRKDGKRKVIQVFNSNPQGSQLEEDPKSKGGMVYKQILVNAKL